MIVLMCLPNLIGIILLGVFAVCVLGLVVYSIGIMFRYSFWVGMFFVVLITALIAGAYLTTINCQ